ncbi:MAG TPA: wax ester/triacylglycerol synthase family O-acyltransferase [Thermoleophilaceae bacterium]|nr:wax ester/triacylglycerol synthase family O-acyltransferase [Thermoleophilaceae bacterium]
MADGRLTGLDASFLHMENGGAHMHVAAVMIFDGEPPPYEQLIEATEARLHLVPRYRQKLAFVPLGQGRPRWVDDPHLNLGYHIRRTSLPAPGSEAQLRALAGRVFSQPLDRDKPLWELWLVEGVEPGPEGPRFAMLSKTHHALVDGISGVDIASVLFDVSPDTPTLPDTGRWTPRPEPTSTQLFVEALLERATVPREAARSLRALFRGPRLVARSLGESAVGVGAMAWAGLRPPPRSPYNTAIGPHRRFAWVRASLDDVKAIKNSLGGTVNDVVLATVAGGLGLHMRRRGIEPRAPLRAMVPVSVRSEDERGSLGNRVAAMMAPLPVAELDPQRRVAEIAAAMQGIKRSGQAVGAQVLTELSGFAPPTLMAQGSRLVSTERFFNLVVTNVPGPQYPLYLLGRELREIHPMVPLAKGQALGIAIMSYNGRMNFGLLGDWDAMPDLGDLAQDLGASLEELAAAAGVQLGHPTPDTRRPVPT